MVSEDTLDRTFAALAHPTRRAILTRLSRGEVASVSALAEPFDVSVMAISKHLRVMEEAGLIRRQKDGRVQRCRFDPEAMKEAGDWIEKHRIFWSGRLDALAEYLEEADSSDEDGRPEEHREET